MEQNMSNDFIRKATERERKSGFSGKALSVKRREVLNLNKYMRPYLVDSSMAMRARKRYWAIKRVFDVVCSSLALVLLSPILLLVMLLIVIDDPSGGPFFKQKRVGRGNKEFDFYKFRSMCVNAEEKKKELAAMNEADGPAFKVKDDPRITRVGKFLRNHSIDELPQLVNILKGDMTIVGPRPPLPYEVDIYDAYEEQRLIVTPGLTCYWQVQPNRHDMAFDDWVALDVKYVEERNLGVDIKLIIQTVLQLFRGNAD